MKAQNPNIKRLNQKRIPPIKFGTLPEGMKSLGSRCPRRCRFNTAGYCTATFCRKDLKKERIREIKDKIMDRILDMEK